MRSKCSRFTLGVWGLSCVRQTLPNRSQPSATVRNRHMVVPMVSFAKGVTFGALQRRVASFRVAGEVLRDIPTCFTTCQKSFCVAGAMRRFQKMRCIFRSKRKTLETSDVILRGSCNTLDVSCCVFSANRIVSAARSGDKVQIPWQAWHFATCDEKIDGSLARNVDFEIGS